MSHSLEALDAYRASLHEALEAAFNQFPARLDIELSDTVQTALGRLRDYTMRGGKRMRGSLAIAAYDAAAGTHLATPGVQMGVALELMQSYLLIIDDIMDKSVLRRGEPTVHEQYASQNHPKTDWHEAQMMAIIVAELAQHMACLTVADIEVPDAALRQAIRLLHTNIVTTGIGQIDDMHQQIGRDVSADDILRKYQAKSSYYTFINPLQCGFALAGKGTSENLEQCKKFGLLAGLAFQLHDDLLGIYGDEKILGKPNLDDVREGKYTLLVHYALEHGTAAEIEQLGSILGNDKANKEDLMTVRNIVERTGAKGHVQDMAAQYAREAQSVLAASGWDKPLKGLLHDVVAFSIARQQ